MLPASVTVTAPAISLPNAPIVPSARLSEPSISSDAVASAGEVEIAGEHLMRMIVTISLGRAAAAGEAAFTRVAALSAVVKSWIVPVEHAPFRRIERGRELSR
jgi:hypothetical protein